jgi:hypothetical protein
MAFAASWEVPMAVAPWIVSDALWKRVEPLLPRRERSFFRGLSRWAVLGSNQ